MASVNKITPGCNAIVYFILRQMCERLIDIINPDDWELIAQRLGLHKDTLLLLEKELPGANNFRHRVSRALGYWSGFAFSDASLIGKAPGQGIPVSTMNLETPKTSPSATDDPNKVNSIIRGNIYLFIYFKWQAF
ncbi:unnamed protein product [Rodentolepis nana]|uniref:Death domain-containing protein n=1 Tax=Rodentolepis nana TaxID=102285 RepID=A0A0R3TIS4_RODNA|nr:unnamed protein product [Rodentolepis nana]